MTTDDFVRTARLWLDDGPTQMPNWALQSALDEIHITRQRRPWWRARRLREMSIPVRVGVAAAAVVAVALVGINVLPEQSGVGGLEPNKTPGSSPNATPAPNPSASPTVTTLPDGPLPAGTYAFAPFGSGPGLDSICQFSQAGCVDTGPPTSMLVSLAVPDGWDSHGLGVWIDLNAPPGGAALGFNRGGWLYSDPCRKPDTTNPDVPVGPSVDDFVNALANHSLLDTTAPVDVTVDGYSGKALDLLVPADISQCEVYRPWQPNIYAQGPGHVWHLRVIDVDGARVVIESMEYAATDPQRRTELEAMVDSIQIEP